MNDWSMQKPTNFSFSYIHQLYIEDNNPCPDKMSRGVCILGPSPFLCRMDIRQPGPRQNSPSFLCIQRSLMGAVLYRKTDLRPNRYNSRI
jgi:hypothetical protein